MKPRIIGLVVCVLFATTTALQALTYTVTNTNDTLTAGTLRQAITDANAHANSPVGTPDRIHFSIPGNGPHTISPGSALPTITDPVVIDGYTQGDSTSGTTADDALENTNATGGLNTVLKIELNGTSAGASNGLLITAGSSTVRGLAINRFGAAGIDLETAGGNVIEGCFVGTNITGTAVSQNGFSGIFVRTANNVIGGTTPAARNLSSGNFYHGVEFQDSTATGNQVQGNLLGTNAAGTASLTGVDSFGVFLLNGPSNNVIGGTAAGAGNIVSGNVNSGIQISDASGNRIEGNYCGVTADGTAALGNGGSGVTIEGTSSNNIVGGTAAGARNILSGNNRGLTITGGTFNSVQGNFIGTNPAGTAAIPNNLHGVRIRSGAANNDIGGTGAGEGNVISGNGSHGIWIIDATTQSNQISQNLIGRNATNTGPLGNFGHGILLESSGPNVIGGGFNPNNANTIAHNGGDGVAVVFGTGPCIKKGIVSNSIFSNGGLGIDLEDDGVTPNDAGDPDTGANTLQNFPVLNSASTSGSNTTINGSLNSTPNTSFHIEFFASAAADPTGYGEGQTFLDYIDVTTDVNGNAPFSAVLPVLPPACQNIISATTTDNAELANTSEFSKVVQLAGTAGRLDNISTRLRVQTGSNVLIGGFIITGADPKKVILRAIGPSLEVNNVPVVGRLADPTLTLYDQSGTEIAFNNDWGDAPEPERSEIENGGLKPDDALESAIIRTLNPGAYTAIVRGKDGTTGIGLVEAYDLSPASNSRLANLSTRGLVETGSNVMIGGVIVGGDCGANARVMVRGIGPSLNVNGTPLAGRMADPTLQLVDENGIVLIENDNWRDTQEAAIQASGLAPSNDFESAIVTILPSGGTTAILRGKDNTTGIALVEVYNF